MLRDREWQAREQSYHDKSLDGINDMVRKYNAMAPYPVRKSYYMLSVELEKAYAECGEDILKGVKERLQESHTHLGHRSGTISRQDPAVTVDGQETSGNSWRILEFLRRWFSRLSQKSRSLQQ
jgi:DnaJ family protein C protein 28